MSEGRFDFIVDTFQTERLKVLSVWSMFQDQDMEVRPRAGDRRGRTPREHMIHQFVSENGWFVNMLGIDIGAPPPDREASRDGFIRRYAAESAERAAALAGRADAWWDAEVAFFEVMRSRAWVLLRRIAHTAHHRGQQTALLRMLGRDAYSTYGPTADTGGLPTQAAPTIYPYPGVDELLDPGVAPVVLPDGGSEAVTERPRRGLVVPQNRPTPAALAELARRDPVLGAAMKRVVPFPGFPDAARPRLTLPRARARNHLPAACGGGREDDLSAGAGPGPRPPVSDLVRAAPPLRRGAPGGRTFGGKGARAARPGRPDRGWAAQASVDRAAPR